MSEQELGVMWFQDEERGHWSKNVDCLYMLERQGNKFFSEGSKMNIALIIP